MLHRPAPEFASASWLNSPPLRLAGLRGRGVLLDFWDYTSLISLRALPFVERMSERYPGLTVIGVHTPLFSFGREQTQVELALRDFDMRYPVLLDNEFKTWNAYQDRFWPSRCLIDRDGLIRFQGSGVDADLERTIQALLREIDPNVDLPALREDEADAAAISELRAGFEEEGALGNVEGYSQAAPILYTLPDQRVEGRFYVSGAWQASREYLAYRGTTEGIVQFPYQAAEVYAVLSPHHDAVERMIHPEAVGVEIWQDDRPLSEDQRGADVTEDGRILVTRPRLYHLIHNVDAERHELSLRVHARGFTLYLFSLVSGTRHK